MFSETEQKELEQFARASGRYQVLDAEELQRLAHMRAEHESEVKRYRAHIVSCWVFTIGGLLLLWIISH